MNQWYEQRSSGRTPGTTKGLVADLQDILHTEYLWIVTTHNDHKISSPHVEYYEFNTRVTHLAGMVVINIEI